MNRTVFEPCVTIDTSDTLNGDLAIPFQVIDRRDRKIRKALCYSDPKSPFIIRIKRSLVLVSLSDLFVDADYNAPSTEEVYDRALLKGLRKPPSYSGVFLLTQNPYWLQKIGLSSCFIGSEPFTGSDGNKYIPRITVSSELRLYVRTRIANEDVRWTAEEPWLFETSTK